MMFSIRAMSPSDVDMAATIAAGLPLAPQWGREVFLEALQSGSSPPRVGLIAEMDGEVSGFAVASILPPQAELESIAVLKAAQGRGLGRRLLDAICQAASLPAIQEMVLEVRESNLVAIRLYQALNFAEVGRRRAYYMHPSEDALVMRRSLEDTA